MDPLAIWHFLILFIVTGVYFIPAFIAFRRHHQNRVAILATNLLLGWTIIGGVAALFWSLTTKRYFI